MPLTDVSHAFNLESEREKFGIFPFSLQLIEKGGNPNNRRTFGVFSLFFFFFFLSNERPSLARVC